MDENKQCWRCKEFKPIGDYCRKGLDSICKPCRYELNAKWTKENREKLRPQRAEYMRRYRAKKAEEAKKKAQEGVLGEDAPKKDE